MKSFSIQFRLLLCLLMVGAMGAIARAQEMTPATEPSTRPTDVQITDWLNQLADVDPDVRQAGVQALMGLTRDDLPRLKAIAKAQGPLMPGQSAALQDVVKQVYLSGSNEKMLPGRGFLGLQWPSEVVVQIHANGLPIVDRFAGFPAYRLLREGDLITEVVNRPDIDVHYIDSFIQSVRAMSPGNVLMLRVQRGRQSLIVPIELAPRPAELPDLGDPTEWRTQRETEENDYWSKNFAETDTTSTVPSTQT